MSCQPRYPQRERWRQPCPRSPKARCQLREPGTSGSVDSPPSARCSPVVTGCATGRGYRRVALPRLQVLPGAATHAFRHGLTWGPRSGRQATAHLLELRPGRHLLGHQRGLDALEQALEPADELGLRDPQLGVRGGGVGGERGAQAVQLVAEVRRQALLQLADRLREDLAEPVAGVVLQQLLDHGADPHDLRGLLHHALDSLVVALAALVARGLLRDAGHPEGAAVRPDDHDLVAVVAVAAAVAWLGHGSIVPHRRRLHRPGTSSRTLPITPPASSIRCASAVRSMGTVACTTGRTRPSASIGHTCSRTPATTAPLPCGPSTGRARSPIAVMLPRLPISALRSSSPFRPPWKPMISSRPSMASASRFAARPFAPMLSRMTSAPWPSVAFLSSAGTSSW